jgi:hypothetical protein
MSRSQGDQDPGLHRQRQPGLEVHDLGRRLLIVFQPCFEFREVVFIQPLITL